MGDEEQGSIKGEVRASGWSMGVVLPFRDTGNSGGEEEGEFSSEYLDFDWPVRFPNADV